MRWLLLLLAACAPGCAGTSPGRSLIRAASPDDEPTRTVSSRPDVPADQPAAVEFEPDRQDDHAGSFSIPARLADPSQAECDFSLSPDLLDQMPEPKPPEPLLRSLARRVGQDHGHYYSAKNLGLLAVGTGLAAAMANTHADETIRDNYQDGMRNVKTDEFSEAIHTPELLGNGYVTIPAFAASALLGQCFDDHPLGRAVGQWGERSLRTVVVGAPPMLAMQWVSGASRPGETTSESHWKPFDDDNGVSGHSFMGAVPFISAAKMTDNPYWKAGFYAASTLAGLSRINDDRHYASQVLLGWWMAYLAATAVDQTQQAGNLTVVPVTTSDFVGLGLEYRR